MLAMVQTLVRSQQCGFQGVIAPLPVVHERILVDMSLAKGLMPMEETVSERVGEGELLGSVHQRESTLKIRV